MPVEAVLAEVRRLRCRRVELTGGEPLLQDESRPLLARLCEEGCEVLLETNGSLDIADVDPRVVRIVDVKCPSSGEAGAMRWENLTVLTLRDEVKFVLADRADYDYAREAIERHDLTGRCAVLLSPMMAAVPGPGTPGAEGRAGAAAPLDPARLAEWILRDGLDVRLNLQLHKIIWPRRERGV
jgi:7-carboxy-7-deazaguanine synthase